MGARLPQKKQKGRLLREPLPRTMMATSYFDIEGPVLTIVKVSTFSRVAILGRRNTFYGVCFAERDQRRAR